MSFPCETLARPKIIDARGIERGHLRLWLPYLFSQHNAAYRREI